MKEFERERNTLAYFAAASAEKKKKVLKH